MADREQIETEIRQYLTAAQNLSNEGRVTHLMAIFDKHFAMESAEHQLTFKDFHEIIGYAKGQYNYMIMPMRISDKEIYSEELPHTMMIEAVITYLNKFKLLRRLVRIDYTNRR